MTPMSLSPGPPVSRWCELRSKLGVGWAIEQGAPADVFISADLRWMDYVAERKINPNTRVNLLGNKLVLIAPAD